MCLHIVASVIRYELEDLTELERVCVVVDLVDKSTIALRTHTRGELTSSSPVTLTIILAISGDDGCASKVVTLCTTFSNGSVCEELSFTS